MAELNARITLDNKDFLTGMDEANRAGGQLNTSLGQQSGAMGSAASAAKGLAGAYLLIKAAKFAVAEAGKGLALSSQIETEKVRLEVLLGSMEEAERLMGRVMAKAGETPLQTTELKEATRMLIAFGGNSETVIDELTRLGDLSQGVGMGIGDLATIYGKARVQGTLFAEDINQLTARGIPIITEFAKIMGVTEGEVKKLASEGKIGFAQLEEAMINMTAEGGRFNGMMEKMSLTFEGQASTLKDNYEQLVLIPVGDWVKGWVGPMVEGLNEAADLVKLLNRDFGAEASESIKGRQEAFANIQTRDDRKTFGDETADAMGAVSVDLLHARARGDDAAVAALEHQLHIMDRLMDLATNLDQNALAANEERIRQEEEIAREKERQAQLDKDREVARDRFLEVEEQRKQREFVGGVPDMDTGALLDAGAQLRTEIEAARDAAWQAVQNGNLEAVNAAYAREEAARARLSSVDRELQTRVTAEIRERAKLQTDAERQAARASREVPRSNPLESVGSVRLEVPELDRFARVGLSLGGDAVESLQKRQVDEMQAMRKELAAIRENTKPTNTDTGGGWA